MASKLLLFMASYFATMAVGPALFLLAVFVFKVDADKLFAGHPLGVCLTIALYAAFVVLMFFFLQDIFIVFKPAPGVSPVPREELEKRFERAFDSPVDGKKIFDFMKNKDRIVITWSSSINYFQITSAGATGKKRVIVLNIDDKNHNIFFIMKDKDWAWNLSKNFFEASLNYSTGIFAEFSTEYRPSIVFDERTGLKIDMKKLTYNSDDLWLPIQTAVLSSGWTLRGGMLPIFYYRLLLAIPLALIVFFMLYPLMRGSANPEAASAKTDANVKTDGSNTQFDVSIHLQKNMPQIKTEQIQFEIDEIIKRQEMFKGKNVKINDYIKTVFITYANNYFSRKDKKADFESRIRIFAKDNEISGLK